MKLVDNWKKCYRWLSMQGFLLAGFLQTTWMGLPAEWKETVPDNLIYVMTIFALILGAVGRLVDQKSE